MTDNELQRLHEIVIAGYLQYIASFAKKAEIENIVENEDVLKSILPVGVSAQEIVRLLRSKDESTAFDEQCINCGARIAFGGEVWKQNDEAKPLVALLSTLKIGGRKTPNKTYYKISKLSDRDSIFGTENKSISIDDYKRLWNDFEKDFSKLKGLNYEDFIASLDSMLLQYLWCVPAVDDDGVDISLYQISKLAASFASILYRFHIENNTLAADDVKNLETPKFLFVNGDVSGIQKYIFDLKSTDESSKLLRAKSFELMALSQALAENLVKSVNGTIADIITTSGGKFMLVLPCTENTKTVLKEKQFEYETFFLKEFGGKLGIIISDGTKANANQLCDKGKVLELINKIGEDGEWAKQMKMQKALKRGQVLDELYEKLQRNGECPCCGIHPSTGTNSEGKSEKCLNCKALAEIGGKLIHAASIRINSDKIASFKEIVDFDGKWKDRSYAKINAYEAGRKVMYLPYVAPRKEESKYEIKTFVDIASVPENGNNKLAMFKADIDNLGLVFTSSLGDRMSFSRYADMSRIFHYFFSAYYVDFVHNGKDKKYRDKIYTVFSGGDDLCVIGNWKDIMQFAADFHKEVEKLTNKNESVTLSAGITLFSSNVPLKFVAAAAEEQLEKSKARTNGKTGAEEKILKNAITVFDTTVSWDEYDKCLEDGKRFEEALSDGTLSTAVVYKMLDFSERVKNVKKGNLRDLMWKSNFRYMAVRNLAKADKELKDWFLDFGADDEKMEKSKIAVSYGLYTQRKSEKQHNAEEE